MYALFCTFPFTLANFLVISKIVIIISLSVTVAMYCLIQLYVAVAEELSPHRPLLKLFSVKAVGMFFSFMMLRSSWNPFPVFLTFWQATLLSVLSMFGVIKGVNITTSMLGISPYTFLFRVRIWQQKTSISALGLWLKPLKWCKVEFSPLLLQSQDY